MRHEQGRKLPQTAGEEFMDITAGCLSDVIEFDEETNTPKFSMVAMDYANQCKTVVLKNNYVDLIKNLINLERKIISQEIPFRKVYNDIDTMKKNIAEVEKKELFFMGRRAQYFFIRQTVVNFWKESPRSNRLVPSLVLVFFDRKNNKDFFDIVVISRNSNYLASNTKNYINCKNYIISMRKVNSNVASKFMTININDVINDNNIYYQKYEKIDMDVPKFLQVAVNNNKIFVKKIELESSAVTVRYDNFVHNYSNNVMDKYQLNNFSWNLYFTERVHNYYSYNNIKNVIKNPFLLKLKMNEKDITKYMIKYPQLFSTKKETE